MGEWKLTIPVCRAETREDGRYLIGEASGPEVDTWGTSMDPECITDYRNQIIERAAAGDPIPYLDNHPKTGGLTELGWVLDGEITPATHLKVLVKLDDANPAAVYYHDKVLGGKQYGMSVKGDGVRARVERSADGTVKKITFLKVVLKEISHVTRPSWTPSLGTVLARSIDGEQGELMAENVEEVAAPEETTDTSDAENVERSDESTAETPAPETPAVEAVEEEVERGLLNKTERAGLRDLYMQFTAKLTELGVDLTPEPPAQPENIAAPSVAPETTQIPVENSDKGEPELVEVAGLRVERSMAEAIEAAINVAVERATSELTEKVSGLENTVIEKQAYIEELENMPAGRFPLARAREKFEQPSTEMPDFATLSNEEKLQYALSHIYSN